MSLSLTPLSSLPLEITVLILCLGIWGYGLYASRFQTTTVRAITSFLRLIILTVAWLIVHELTMVTTQSVKKPRHTAVLMDRSGSMFSGNNAPSGTSRINEGMRIVETLQKEGIKTMNFSFADQLSPGIPVQTSKNSETLPMASSGTDFMSALTQLIRQNPDLGQIILISDGHDFSPLSRMSPDQIDAFVQVNAIPPIHSVYIGTMDETPDMLVHSVEAPSFSYIRSPLKIDVTMLARKMTDTVPQIQLLEDQKVIQFQSAALDEHGFGRGSFEIYPDQVGEHLYQIHIPPHADEKNTKNNTQSFLVKTGRDKINVLHIAGSVTPDLQGLRSVFERDPFIEFTAFYILRTREHSQISINGRAIPPDEMALVQFPVEEIFDRQLFSFDVVIFQDFDAGNYFRNSYQARKLLRKITTFVTDQHGGLVFISGPRTASGPSLALTPIGSILPVPPKAFRTRYHDGFQDLKPAEKGDSSLLEHPLLQGFEGGLPRIFGYMETGKPHKNTRILLKTKTNEPVLATRLVGNGRTLFLNTSSSWVWRREAMISGRTGADYDHFWRNMLKWASGDPSFNPIQIQTSSSRENPLLLKTEILLRDDHFRPLSRKQGTVRVQSVDHPDQIVELPFTTSRDGVANLSAALTEPGFYRVLYAPDPNAKTPSSDKKSPSGSRYAIVKNIFLGGSMTEYRESDPRPETLRLLSSATGGRFFEHTDTFSTSAIDSTSMTVESVVSTRRTRLRDSILLLPILLLLAGLEWFVRRQNHLA